MLVGSEAGPTGEGAIQRILGPDSGAVQVAVEVGEMVLSVRSRPTRARGSSSSSHCGSQASSPSAIP
jgi:hypothetical protein